MCGSWKEIQGIPRRALRLVGIEVERVTRHTFRHSYSAKRVDGHLQLQPDRSIVAKYGFAGVAEVVDAEVSKTYARTGIARG